MEWTNKDGYGSYTAFVNNKIVAYTEYTGKDDKYNPDKLCIVILTNDGYLFVLGYLEDVELSKNVCELALSENKDWQWWLDHLNKWWYENVSQL